MTAGSGHPGHGAGEGIRTVVGAELDQQRQANPVAVEAHDGLKIAGSARKAHRSHRQQVGPGRLHRHRFERPWSRGARGAPVVAVEIPVSAVELPVPTRRRRSSVLSDPGDSPVDRQRGDGTASLVRVQGGLGEFDCVGVAKLDRSVDGGVAVVVTSDVMH